MFKKETPSTQTSNTLEQQVEALLFYFAKEMTIKELATMTGSKDSEVKTALETLQASYADRGLSIVIENKKAALVTSSDQAELIAKLQEQEDEKALSKAALETLSIIAYNGPVNRAEIDYIRGVNSTYSIRSLLVRGLIEKVRSGTAVSYTPTLDTLQFMGVQRREELPQFNEVKKQVAEILQKKDEEESQDQAHTDPDNKEEQNEHG